MSTLLAAGFGGSGVVAGAFGAHALKGLLGADALAVWGTAVQYQLWHALALLGLAALAPALPARAVRGIAWAFAAGIVLFCGSLYLLALGAPRGLGPLTPIGGLALIGGWAGLAWAAWRTPHTGDGGPP
nr:DUF423 domain-containing protein [Dokdonella koreensis]